MARLPRIHIEGALFYVTSRGDNERQIFKDKEDYSAYQQLLKKYQEQYGFKLLAYCFLPNHLHLLMELKEGLTVSEIMHDLNANYTKYFNARYGRKGHLFRERYKMKIIEKDHYLSMVITYILRNPLALGLVGKSEEYNYCSYASSDMGARPQVLDSEESLRSFAKRMAKKAVLGSEDFLRKVKEVNQRCLKARKAAHPVNRRFVLVGAAAVLILGIVTFHLYRTTMTRQFESEIDSYYKGVSHHLELEKQKVRVLEQRLGVRK